MGIATLKRRRLMSLSRIDEPTRGEFESRSSRARIHVTHVETTAILIYSSTSRSARPSVGPSDLDSTLSVQDCSLTPSHSNSSLDPTMSLGEAIKAASTLPIINIAPWVEGHDHKGRLSTAAAIHAACLEFGFFYLDVTSCIPPGEPEELSRLAREFFHLPQEEKDKISLNNQDHARGALSTLPCQII